MFSIDAYKYACIAIAMPLSWSALADSSMEVALSSEASRPAVNDSVRATLSAEASAPSLNELSKQINQSIADALKTAKAYPSIKVKTGNTNTFPVYAKNGKIESWRMRSDVLLESGDSVGISELLGKLQASLSVASLTMTPSPETRKTAENEATLDAIDLFKARAKTLSTALGRSYSIKELTISTDNRFTPLVQQRYAKTMSLASDAVPMPMEAGESLVTVSVSGKIEVQQ